MEKTAGCQQSGPAVSFYFTYSNLIFVPGWFASDSIYFEVSWSPGFKTLYRAIGSEDVSLDIAYCGVCYADVVWTRNKTGYARYPVELITQQISLFYQIIFLFCPLLQVAVLIIPKARHEITGIARQVGSHVKRFKSWSWNLR